VKALQRQKGKEKLAVEPEGAAPPSKSTVRRSVQEILAAYASEGLENFVLTKEELISLIDNGAELEDKRRKIAKEVDAVVTPTKALLLALAEKDKWKEKSGKIGVCKIGGGSSTIIGGTVTDFAALLKREGKLHLFNDLVSVKLGDSKKYLGEDALKDFMHSDTREYSSVSLGLKK
jgi:hypothetical protein